MSDSNSSNLIEILIVGGTIMSMITIFVLAVTYLYFAFLDTGGDDELSLDGTACIINEECNSGWCCADEDGARKCINQSDLVDSACPTYTAPTKKDGDKITKNCQMSAWGEWGACTGTPLMQKRTRTMVKQPIGDGTACPTNLEEEKVCDERTADCTSFGSWGTCTERKQKRWAKPGENSNSSSCAQKFEEQDCNDCDYTPWQKAKADGVLGTECVGGKQRWKRTIKESNRGANVVECTLPLTKEESCDVPIDCITSNWTPWSICDNNRRTRTRTKLTEASFGGNACGNLSETQDCHNKIKRGGKCLQTYGVADHIMPGLIPILLAAGYRGLTATNCDDGQSKQRFKLHSNDTIRTQPDDWCIFDTGNDNPVKMQRCNHDTWTANKWAWDGHRFKNKETNRCLKTHEGENGAIISGPCNTGFSAMVLEGKDGKGGW